MFLNKVWIESLHFWRQVWFKIDWFCFLPWIFDTCKTPKRNQYWHFLRCSNSYFLMATDMIFYCKVSVWIFLPFVAKLNKKLKWFVFCIAILLILKGREKSDYRFNSLFKLVFLNNPKVSFFHWGLNRQVLSLELWCEKLLLLFLALELLFS